MELTTLNLILEPTIVQPYVMLMVYIFWVKNKNGKGLLKNGQRIYNLIKSTDRCGL